MSAIASSSTSSDLSSAVAVRFFNSSPALYSIVVIARNSISLAIGIGVIFFLLSEGGPVESKKRHCKWRALTLILNKALLRSWSGL